jgi:hypothetical protein
MKIKDIEKVYDPNYTPIVVIIDYCTDFNFDDGMLKDPSKKEKIINDLFLKMKNSNKQ